MGTTAPARRFWARTDTVGPPRPVARMFKRFTDISFAVFLLVGFSPIMAVAAAAIRLDSPGPVIFRQVRSGRDGVVFTMFKLRSMVSDADAQKAHLVSDSFDGRVFKHKHDPRITRVGAFLRRYSIDELPQLINVIKGEMSLVGPRPYLPHETMALDAEERRRVSVRPGMTGLGQVSGRADLSWSKAMSLDLIYVDRWSPAMDASILARTVGAVLGGRGAY